MFDLLTGITSPESAVTPDEGVLAMASDLLGQAQKCRQRRTLVFAGESDWCRQMAGAISGLPELRRVVWVSSEKLPGVEVVEASTVKSLLGQECDAVVFDARSGFDPDAFGAICGIISAGGLLMLLCPPLSEWEQFADPASDRISISPFSYQDISGRFIRRLIGVIRNADGTTIVEQHKPLPSVEFYSTDSVADESLMGVLSEGLDSACRTKDQQSAFEAITHVVEGHRRRPAVLVSDRGRGKSSALGIAAAHLLVKKGTNARAQADGSSGVMRIVVTAPRRNAVEALFFHAQKILQQELPETKIVDNSLHFNGSQIQYISPDELCSLQISADLVLVDEAAAIPVSILDKLLKKYSRIAFATTVHGYEGTGRGFAVRFRETLNEETPGWNEVRLQAPIRWAENDSLEQLVFRSLLLDAESVKDEKVLDVNVEEVIVECLDRENLVNDEQALSQVFGLLVTAHYRTTPNDLRNLLDGPGVSVYVLRSSDKSKDHILATALVSAEGEFSDALTDAIFAGQRRPRGHLIPQSLVAHAGIKQAGKLRCARIMRIAVQPVLQGKGLGSALVNAIQDAMKDQGFHMVGVSFGATARLMKFWRAQGMHPVRVGFRRDHSSGEHSVMMLRPLGEQGEEVFLSARNRLLDDMPAWLADSLDDLNCNVAVECLRNENSGQLVLSGVDEQTVFAFANGERSYEDSSAALWRFTVAVLMNHEYFLSENDRVLLVARILQKRPWKDVAMLCDLTGRAEVIKALRNRVHGLLKQE